MSDSNTLNQINSNQIDNNSSEHYQKDENNFESCKRIFKDCVVISEGIIDNDGVKRNNVLRSPNGCKIIC